MDESTKNTSATAGTTRPIACLLSEAEQARRGAEVAEQIFGHVIERRELDDGYAFRLPGDGEWFDRVAAFVAAERRCCPFFRFEIVSEPDAGPIWLTLRGEPDVREDVKVFIAATFPPGRSFSTAGLPGDEAGLGVGQGAKQR
jgi:hypothetical protein